jgi:hypothetical protein
MSRLKLVLLVLIIAALGMLFVQNRELLALRLLCPEQNQNQSCLYQTPSLPLAAWMALFIVGGMVTSLLGQMLNRYRYASGGRQKSNINYFEEDRPQWQTKNNRSNKYAPIADQVQDSTIRDKNSSGSYEIPQQPESVERSGSTYSYKYRNVNEGNPTNESASSLSPENNKAQKTSIRSEIDSNFNQDKDDEDWI